MALSVPSIPNPFDSVNPIAPAYAWLAGIYLDISQNAGRVVLNVHPNENAWTSQPVAQIAVGLGENFTPADPTAVPPVEAVTFPTLAELMADASFASAYNVIGTTLYQHLLSHPRLEGSSII